MTTLEILREALPSMSDREFMDDLVKVRRKRERARRVKARRQARDRRRAQRSVPTAGGFEAMHAQVTR